jgi:FRG domain
MRKLKIKHIDSFKDYIAFIENLRTKNAGPIWYRGCGKISYELKPSLYRHKKSNTIEDLMHLEDDIIARFKQRSIPFHSRTITDQWDLLFFMQHFGIPTRLLDWSESPLMALFFAVTLSKHKLGVRGIPVYENDAAIWVLDPIKWNKRAIDLKSFTDKVLTTDDANANAYKPVGDCKAMKEYPIAIYGAHNSQRIVAQRGVFVCFGKSTDPMEKMYLNHAFPKDCLVKLNINRSKLPHFFEAIHKHGVSDSVVFPDLEGLAREIKREFKFEV